MMVVDCSYERNPIMDLAHMSDQDLLALVIGQKATEAFYRGTLLSLFHNHNLPTHQHLKLLAARELVTRMLYEEVKRDISFNAPEVVKRYLLSRFSGQEHESFLILFLDAQNRLIDLEEAFRGTLCQTSVYPREVVKLALRHNAAAVIFAHNHPSGVAEPSRADEMLTQSLRQALGLVDVKVLDHLIIAGGTALSMAERGLL